VRIHGHAYDSGDRAGATPNPLLEAPPVGTSVALLAVTELWIPGAAGPHDDFVGRLHRLIERFAERNGVQKAIVTLELHTGARFDISSIAPEPGYGFVSVCPHGEEDAPAELIIPIGTIARIELRRTEEEEPKLGFSMPEPARD
jgi:hypothetical protein